MLSLEPQRSGYDIRKTVESSVSYFWRESYGQIYPALKHLAAAGLIRARPTRAGGRPGRREYALTAAGRARLRAWLATPCGDAPPRNEFLLKLFFSGAASRRDCETHMRTFRENNQRLLDTLLELETRARAAHVGNPHLPFWLLTLSFGIAQLRASVQWSDAALGVIGSETGGLHHD
jgi:DNA-binding PadR family transcriptional regulator